MVSKISSLRKWFIVVLVITMFAGGICMTIAEDTSGSSKAKSKAKADDSGKKKESGKKSSSSGRARGGRTRRSSSKSK